MEIPKDITYCIGRTNTINECVCVNCERYIRIHDFRNEMYSLSNFNIFNIFILNDNEPCEYFMKREY